MIADSSFDCLVIGAGIAGLTVASELVEAGIRVAVLEGSDSVGGAIRTVEIDGYRIEEGPNSLLDTSPEVTTLLDRAGLAEKRIFAGEEAKNRYVVRGGRPIALPLSPAKFFATPLFSWRAKARLLREPFTAPWDNRYEESVAEFVRRRLGSEFLDYAINPFVAGVYAGDPETLSVPHAFPRLHALEQRYGSLIKGQILGARERKQRAEASKQSARMYSFADGLAALPRGLADLLGDRLHTGLRVEKGHRARGTWHLDTTTQGGERRTLTARSIVFAGRLPDLRTLSLDGMSADAVKPLLEVVHPPVTVFGLGYTREKVGHPLDGFGVLVPQVENRHILGVLFSSTLFPGRAPEGHVLLTVFVGGTRQPELAEMDTKEVLPLVQRDLADLLEVQGEPALVYRRVWPQAIPQYEVGYGEVKTLLESLESSRPGLFFAGNYRGGISVPDTIKHSLGVARRAAAYLSNQPTPS